MVPQFLAIRDAKEKVLAGAFLVDVRTPSEYEAGTVPGAVNIPLNQLMERLREFGDDAEREIVLFCEVGGRSERAKQALESMGYTNVFNAGGYKDWL